MIAFILGLGKSGQTASRLALLKNYHVYAFDESNSIKLSEELIKDKKFHHSNIKKISSQILPTIIIASPGLNSPSPLYQFANQFTCPVISEIEFANQFNNRPIIAVTGTNGKSTVTEMIVYLLKQIGKKALAIGNYGTTYSEFIYQHKNYDIGVLEISSFQLEKTSKLTPQVAILTNLASDHQERYASFQEYIKVKLKLLNNLHPEKILIGEECKQYIKNYKKFKKINFYGFKKDNFLEISNKQLRKDNEVILDFDKTALQGKHNYLNCAASLGALLKLKLPLPKTPLKGFAIGEHKQETIHNFPLIINDSKATNPHALKAILCNFSHLQKKIYLIAGGKDKKMNFSLVNNLLSKYVEEVYLYGESKNKLLDCWSSYVKCILFDDFESTVKQALANLSRNDVLVFSPACASQDMFTNYKERGKKFKKLIREWQKK